MTPMSLYGAYPADDQDEEYPRIKHGHPKDRRYDLKQIQAGLAVTGDGGIPLLSRVIDGGAAEISRITGTMNRLRAMAGPKEFLLIADSKLISYGNVTALIKAGTGFIAPAPASKVDDAVYAALPRPARASTSSSVRPEAATTTPQRRLPHA
ncbi:hypothetical protein [Streptomyces sp. NPDC002463]|uniref:hypothetical protein n=1 Tax=Streptomyces sp. NPDC002463 TaxID=3364645 RepID=UPI0036753860